MAEARAWSEQMVRGDGRRYKTLEAAFKVFGVAPELQSRVLTRWKEAGRPGLGEFAPYATYNLKVDLFFYLSLQASLISSQRASNRVDIAYLYYLPFCMIFTSGDRLHENISPLFLREDQEFLWAPKLKEDLGRLDAGCWGATEQNAELRILFHCSPIPQYNIPIIHPLAQQVNRALGPYSLPLLQRTFGHVNPALGLLFNLAALASILFVLSMTLIPNLERLFLRDLIRRGEREGRKVEAIRERVQVRLEKKNHAR